MAYDADEIEEKLDKFVESSEQYSNEPINDLASLKPQLLDIFKTHHPIKLADIKHGLSKTLEENSQLIIHHFKNDRSLVREYYKAEDGSWKCCECTRTGATAENNDDNNDIHVEPSESTNDVDVLLVERGIIFTKNDHYCEPRLLSYMYRIQKYYKEKKMSPAIALQKKTLGTEDAPFIPVKQKRVVARKKKVEEADALHKDVLDSEHLNVVSSKQKAAKQGTKASSAKITEDIAAEVRLQYAQLQEKDSQENRPSISDEQYDENQDKLPPQDAFAKIIENLEEYTNESKEVVMANKSHILSILKTHRPVKTCNYQYGLLANLRNDRRLIVFEWGDKRRVRVYSLRNDRKELWRCLECYRQYFRRALITNYTFLHLVNGIVFIHANHNCNCKPRDYLLVMIYQNFLEHGEKGKAVAMARWHDFSYGQSFAPSTVNALDAPSTSLLPKKTTSKRKMVSGNKNNCISSEENSPAQKRSKLNKSTLDDTLNDENDQRLLDEQLPAHNKSKLKKNKPQVDEEVVSTHLKSEPTASVATNSIYHFEKPPTTKLQEICDKFNIEYRNKAAKLWNGIKFGQIDTASKPRNTHYFETDNFYQILSIFFTGKSKQHEQIKTTIIHAFREKMVSSGEISTKKFNKKYFDTVTDEHFAFIAKYLSCRILIFDGENGVQKYGKWKSATSIRITLVVALIGGYYSIVLSL